MSEFPQQPSNRFRAQTDQNLTFKSSIFERRDFGAPSPKQMQQAKRQLLNPLTGSYFSPAPTQNNPKPSYRPSNFDSNKNVSRQMFSSSMFGVEPKPLGGSLFEMARTVEQKNDSLNIEAEKEKNKYSFLQVPKQNPNNPNESTNNDIKAMGASMLYKQVGFVKTPSFLKKQAKTIAQLIDERPEGVFKKPEFQKESSKYAETDKKSEASQKKTSQKQKNTPQNFSPMLIRTKIGSISPMNSSDSKNQSTNEPKESSSNNTLLDPRLIPQKGTRKGSFIFQHEKEFYTPTQKNSAKLGSSNFIEIAEKYNSTYNGTHKNENKSQFLAIYEQEKSNLLSPLVKESQKKTQIPSFIKFKEKRNEIFSKEFSNSKTFTNVFTSQPNQGKKWKVDDFQIKQRLGKGAFGDVFLARQKQIGFFCVLKKLSKKKIKEQNTQQLIMREIKIQSFLVHRHITNLYGFFDDEEYIYLIMEYMSDGSLAQRFNRRKVPEKQVASIVKQICDGLKYIHIENIIHRDIKPDNVFIHEDYIKLGDFGCSVFSDSKRNTMVGSLAYFSPEQLNNESYDEKIDIWSVGILCYELLTGKSPFQEDIMKIARQQKEAKLSQLRFPSKLQLSQEAKDLTRKLLQEMPENRLSIMETLKHPFIQKNSVMENLINFNDFSI